MSFDSNFAHINLIFILISTVAHGRVIFDCGGHCHCESQNNALSAKCNDGNLSNIDLATLLYKIPENITKLLIEPPKDHQNHFMMTSDFIRFSGLKELRLRRCNLYSLGRRVFEKANSLKILDVSENLIDYVSVETFENFDQLNELYLDNNLLGHNLLPSSSFLYLKHLKTLSMSNNNLAMLPNNFFNGLTQLTTLIMDGNDLQLIKADIFDDLPNLTKLSLNRCNLSAFPRALFLKSLSLKHLELAYNKLIRVPTELLQYLNNLESLNLRGNFIAFLPDFSLQKTSLESLSLAENFFGVRGVDHNPTYQSIQQNAFKGSNLRELDLSFNGYNRFSSKTIISAAATLTSLHLSGNPLHVISQEQTAGLHLKELHLANTNIKNLPAMLPFEYRRLETLNLSGNPLSRINPENMRYLYNLKVLDISNAQFSKPADDLVNLLRSLTNFSINGNPWHCDCNIMKMRDLANIESSNNYQTRPSVNDLHETYCMTPQNLRNLTLFSLYTATSFRGCTSPIFGAIGLTKETEIGLLTAGAVLIGLIIALACVVACTYWKPKAASYKTREGSRLNDSNDSNEQTNYPIIRTIAPPKERLF